MDSWALPVCEALVLTIRTSALLVDVEELSVANEIGRCT